MECCDWTIGDCLQTSKEASINGDVSDDLGWPLTPQTSPIFAFFVAVDIFVLGERRDFKFGTQVDRN